MKPSERRALEAEKRARKEAEARERELQKAARKAEKSDYASPQDKAFDVAQYESAPNTASESYNDFGNASFGAEESKPPKTKKKKGNGLPKGSFFSNNARLIAFIITTAVALFVIGPLGYDIYLNVRDAQRQGTQVEGKGEMTVEALIDLAEYGEQITWSSMESFTYTEYSGGDVREFVVEGTSLTVRVGKSKNSKYPEYVRLINYRTGALVEEVRGMSVYDLKDFIDENS